MVTSDIWEKWHVQPYKMTPCGQLGLGKSGRTMRGAESEELFRGGSFYDCNGPTDLVGITQSERKKKANWVEPVVVGV